MQQTIYLFQGPRSEHSERVPPGKGLRAQDSQPEAQQGQQQQRRQRGHGLGFGGVGVAQGCGERIEPNVN